MPQARLDVSSPRGKKVPDVKYPALPVCGLPIETTTRNEFHAFSHRSRSLGRMTSEQGLDYFLDQHNARFQQIHICAVAQKSFSIATQFTIDVLFTTLTDAIKLMVLITKSRCLLICPGLTWYAMNMDEVHVACYLVVAKR